MTSQVKIGISGRVLAIPEPGGARTVARQISKKLGNKVDDTIIFGDDNLIKDFPESKIRSDGYVSESLLFGVCWEQVAIPILGKKENIDVLITPTGLCPKNTESFKNIVYIQDIPGYHGYGYKPYILFRKATLPHVVRRADHIITVSQFTRTDICENLGVSPEKISVVHNGISEYYLDKSESGAYVDLPRPYILYVGAMSDRKNISGLIESFILFKNKYNTNHSLVLVGPSKNATYNRLSVDSADEIIDRYIYETDYLTKKQLKFVYKNADTFVFPSHHESFGLPPLEAAACEVPVVTSRAGAIPEILGDHAEYVNPNNPSDIADGIMTSFLYSETCPRIKKARVEAEKYTWDNSVQKLLSVIDELLGNATIDT
jgi:glycosyltransferase involved in cell wall biosynthesis